MPITGFRIKVTSSALTRRTNGLVKLTQGDALEYVVRGAAVKTAQTLVKPLREAAKAAGGSTALVKSIAVHDVHGSTLVLRQPADSNDVIVGVDALSPTALEADELEWGTYSERPYQWVAATVRAERARVVQTYSVNLTKALHKVVVSR